MKGNHCSISKILVGKFLSQLVNNRNKNRCLSLVDKSNQFVNEHLRFLRRKGYCLRHCPFATGTCELASLV